MVRKIYKKLDMIGWLTPVPPDRLRRTYAGALGEFPCSHEFAALPQPAAGEPCRQAPGSSVVRDGMAEMANPDRKMIEMRPIGFVSRASPNENDRDKSLVARVVFDEDLAPALDRIEEWSHIYVIVWLDKVVHSAGPKLRHQDSNVGVLAARSPIHPNPCGWYGDPIKECTCSNSMVSRYQKRISGPLLDRIDIHIEVPRVEYEKLSDEGSAIELLESVRRLAGFVVCVPSYKDAMLGRFYAICNCCSCCCGAMQAHQKARQCWPRPATSPRWTPSCAPPAVLAPTPVSLRLFP
jgi:tRNA (Thr-GGU) A37 N-methylase